MSILANLHRIVRPGSAAAAGAAVVHDTSTRARLKAAAAANAKSRDNRVAPRLSRSSSAQLLQYPAGRHTHPIDVQVTDYSTTGIGVIHTEGLIIGRKFVVREPHVTDGNTCLFTVVRSDPRPDGTFSIGLHVGNSLDDEHDPLLELPPAPGIARSSKLLFVFFALMGIALIAVGVMLKH
jgi:hypothetical protein